MLIGWDFQEIKRTIEVLSNTKNIYRIKSRQMTKNCIEEQIHVFMKAITITYN